MAISPPSDIVLGVARAAEPSSQAAATNRLMSLGPVASEPGDFSAVFGGYANPAVLSDAGMSGGAWRHQASGGVGGVAEKFEAFLLQQFVETMLPKDAEAVYGSGTAGSVWKSMLAEQLGGQIAAGGGVGLADALGIKDEDAA